MGFVSFIGLTLKIRFIVGLNSTLQSFSSLHFIANSKNPFGLAVCESWTLVNKFSVSLTDLGEFESVKFSTTTKEFREKLIIGASMTHPTVIIYQPSVGGFVGLRNANIAKLKEVY